MSFSTDVKKELSRHYTKAAHCQAAELVATILFQGREEANEVILSFEEEEQARKSVAQIKKTLGVVAEVIPGTEPRNRKRQSFQVVLQADAGQEQILPILSLAKENPDMSMTDSLLKKTCCRRAFLRGAFLASGMISDPEKQYHLEIACRQMQMAEYIKDLIRSFQINARISKRRERYIVYIKEGVEIVDMLNVMEAHVALMQFENIRIVREMRGNVNRKVNCETANIGKTVNAAMKQIEDIHFIKETIGFDELDSSLKEIAQVRLDHPDTPLSKLGDLMDPPLGKSGVNHRLRKLGSIAEDLRKQNQP